MEKVGLVVIDEQHKFGVEQRTGLLSLTSGFKDRAPHLLTMTATPIPRTLALAYLADLDLSVITEMPKNRRKITTWFVPAAKRPNAYEWIKKKLQEEKSQAYIVCPFVEESEKETLKSVKAATKEYESLKEFFKPLRAELIHGRLKAAAKEIIMNQLAEGKIDVLVATPVVEVGLDNPNATIIVIEAAERFGLASLHQLRGRVGRGEKQSYCLLFSGKNSPENSSRLKLLEKCSSGLRLAELDLKNRGGGSFFGKVQSGFHQTKIADLSDTNLLLRAKKWAEFILTNKNLRNTFDPRLTDRAIFHPD